jgi:uncharacterized protein (TIGR02266 family)
MKKQEADFEGAERRRHPRKEVWIEIHYQHLDDFFYDYAINLSRGGMFIKTSKPITIGTEIKLRFTIPDHKEVIETKGNIVRVVKPDHGQVHAPGMGIEFRALSEKDLNLINSLWEKDIKAHKENG